MILIHYFHKPTYRTLDHGSIFSNYMNLALGNSTFYRNRLSYCHVLRVMVTCIKLMFLWVFNVLLSNGGKTLAQIRHWMNLWCWYHLIYSPAATTLMSKVFLKVESQNNPSELWNILKVARRKRHRLLIPDIATLEGQLYENHHVYHRS